MQEGCTVWTSVLWWTVVLKKNYPRQAVQYLTGISFVVWYIHIYRSLLTFHNVINNTPIQDCTLVSRCKDKTILDNLYRFALLFNVFYNIEKTTDASRTSGSYIQT